MKSIIFELVSEYLLEQNNIVLLTILYEVSLEIKMYLFLHNIYKKKKPAYLLNIVVKSLEIYSSDIQEIIDDKRTFKYILNAFYSATNNNYIYVDACIKTYKLSVFDYRVDLLNPFRYLKLFKLNEFKTRMQNNLIFNMALMHADMPYSNAKSRELSEY